MSSLVVSKSTKHTIAMVQVIKPVVTERDRRGEQQAGTRNDDRLQDRLDARMLHPS